MNQSLNAGEFLRLQLNIKVHKDTSIVSMVLLSEDYPENLDFQR